MGLTAQQSQSLYGTPAYAGWGETEASYDARARGLSGGGNSGGGFNFENEVDKAFGELGAYYSNLIDEAKGDLNKALSRLQEDYDTGKRFKMQNFQESSKAIDLAQEAFSTDAQKAYRTLATRQLQRGINRGSAFDPGGDKGIADVEKTRLGQSIDLGQEQIDLQRKNLGTAFEQSNLLAETELGRSKVDLPEKFNRYQKNLEEERKLRAGELALSRQQRAFQRFEAGLV